MTKRQNEKWIKFADFVKAYDIEKGIALADPLPVPMIIRTPKYNKRDTLYKDAILIQILNQPAYSK